MTSQLQIVLLACVAVGNTSLSRGGDLLWQDPIIIDTVEKNDLLISTNEVLQQASESAQMRLLYEKRIDAACFFDCLASINALPSTPSNNIHNFAIAPFQASNTVIYPLHMMITVAVKSPYGARQLSAGTQNQPVMGT